MAKGGIHYVCDGSCKADISEARYKAGLTKCGAEGCTMHGHRFRKAAKKK